MRMVFREKYSHHLYWASREEIEAAVHTGCESAMFSFQTRRYAVEVALYEDDFVLVQIWDIENDCPCTKSVAEQFIRESVAVWSDVVFSMKRRRWELEEQ